METEKSRGGCVGTRDGSRRPRYRAREDRPGSRGKKPDGDDEE